MAELFVGTSGWIYKSWKGRFYPNGIKESQHLSFYANHFSTTEINYSFYKLPSENAFLNWREQTPEQFTFAVKASRFLTHLKKLKEPEEPWERLLDRATKLESKLGPILLQFPANWPVNLERLAHFLECTKNASPPAQDLRLAFEFRNDSWFCREVIELLQEHGTSCLVVGDSLRYKRVEIITSNFMYVRYHGRTPYKAPNYSEAQLEDESKKIKKWLRKGLDVYVYFNNDAEGRALENAFSLLDILARTGTISARKAG